MSGIVSISWFAGQIFNKLSSDFFNKHYYELNQRIRDELLADAPSDFRDRVWAEIMTTRGDNKLLGSHSYNGILLPRGTRFIFRSAGQTIFVIEETPQIREITFSYGFISGHRFTVAERWRGADKRVFRLAFPYVIFIFMFFDGSPDDEMNVYSYFSNRPLTSPNNFLYQNCLPNINDDGLICMPRSDGRYDKKRTYAEIVEAAIDHYWKSMFTVHNAYLFDRMMYADEGLRSLWEWERRSAQKPTFVLHIRWDRLEKLKKTIRRETEVAEREASEEVFEIMLDEYNSSKKQLADRIHYYIESLHLPENFRERLESELRIEVKKWVGELLTRIKQDDKKGSRRAAKEIREFFADLFGEAQTTKGGGK